MTKHSMAKSKIYNIWKGMIKRCRVKPNDRRCVRYGLRGITVCDEWKNDFISFYQWSIKSGYKDGLSIDRIDNDGNYCPENCRWVDAKTQCNNRVSNHKLIIDGVSKNVTEWSRISGVKDITIFARLKRGWSEKDAVFGKVRVDVRMVEVDGRNHTLAEWSSLTGIGKDRIFRRLQEGWSERDAVLTPSLRPRKK